MTKDKQPLDPAIRHLLWDACYNAREVGGYPTQDGGEIAWRTLVRTDNLSRLSSAGQATLIEYGVRTIIDLRHPSELAMEPHAFITPFITPGGRADALVYYNLPLINFEDEVWQTESPKTPTTPGYYCLTLDIFKPQVRAIMQAVAATKEGSVLVHCHAGKDRTGMVLALLLALAGVSYEIIATDYALSNHYLQPWYQQLLAQHVHDPERQKQLTEDFKTLPEFMLEVLAYLDAQYGSVHEYLVATGLTQPEIEQIRQRLRA
jgi:protein-tyrosine phosphatase